MSTNRTSRNIRTQYSRQTKSAQESVSMAQNASTLNTSESGAKRSGKPYQTYLQYGRTNSSLSATLQNGGASAIDISDKAQAILALSDELKELEKLQLEIGEKMSILIFEQMRLSEKCRIINRSMEALVK
jgi:hypothetical protein